MLKVMVKRFKDHFVGSKYGMLTICALGAVLVGAGLAYQSQFITDPEPRSLASDGSVYSEADELVDKDEVDPIEEYPHTISKGSNLSTALRGLGVTPQEVHELVKAAKPVYNLGRVSSSVRMKLEKNSVQQNLEAIEFRFSAVEKLRMERRANVWTPIWIEEKVEIQTRTYVGSVESTLWDSAVKAQMNPILIAELAEVFGSQIDFSREIRMNDRWRLAVEEQLVKGRHYKWGSILAAEYQRGTETHTALLYRTENGTEKRDVGYFAPNGESLRKMFLKSPLKYGRVTSRFQRARFHPILKVRRPHLGVDYAAPTGTPIRSVGDGVVMSAGWSGGGGKVIKIRHGSTYQTAYKHLSRFGSGIRAGTRVKQGDVIGYVGSTGLSTAPHLHFEFFVNGKFVDPLSQRFPSADPLRGLQLADFKAQVGRLVSYLPEWAGSSQVALSDAPETSSAAKLGTFSYESSGDKPLSP